MNLLNKQNLPPSTRDETVFRVSFWGSCFSFIFFLLGLLLGAAFLIYSCFLVSILGIVLSGLYTLLMMGVCHIVFRTLVAIRSPSNWLARIGSGGILLKYRSYLHDDSPGEDPIALKLSWLEIADAQLQQELHTTSGIDGKSQIERWFLVIKLDPRYLHIDRIKEVLDFENQRKPAHFKVDDLKHELFLAQKNKAADLEITRIKKEIEREKKLYPGSRSKMQFQDRPIVFISPDQLKMEWTHITPGRKKLRQLLARYTTVIADQVGQRFDFSKEMTDPEFQSQLTALLGRDEKIEAIKLVRLKMGLGLAEAKSYVEKYLQ
ncbi:MAG: hypothetical protein GJV46_09980 [Geobacter sp.]|nr:hypothetical protein [Geobacter sp.]